MRTKHTPGPWVAKHISGSNFAIQRFEFRSAAGLPTPIFNKDTSAIDCTTACVSPHDAKLIAAAPELLEALLSIVENEERRGFEDWLQRISPGGDCEQVHSQWLESSDYEDFCSAWAKQLAVIAKTTA
ncbi:hypothetical protein C4K26_2126 [Pseudomonas chlororaphis]|uniref:hypothetical protein n=1 Tax=Pseudomonas chlororaphis TaxID=587753 RepID=UPI000F55E958|nr:hypothetical protein [Pseudomonas chlororaphis]AZD07529.1 hypothetical protein C4K26_2126 [Pseudomonas chlororaphis]